MNKTGPTINKGRSKQDYGTPDDFKLAVETRFGSLSFDLAASRENTLVQDRFFSEEDDSLSKDWNAMDGNLWLNPPFASIGPWAKKCAETRQDYARRIFLLVPASVGSDWFRWYVHDHAFWLSLSPRITFKGAKDPYPKDLVLACYMHGLHGFDTWRWK